MLDVSWMFKHNAIFNNTYSVMATHMVFDWLAREEVLIKMRQTFGCTDIDPLRSMFGALDTLS